MFKQRDLFRLHCKPEMKFFLIFFVLKANILLNFSKVNDDFIFACKKSDFCHYIQRINQINAKYAVEKAHNKTKFYMICKPEKPFKNFWMNQEVVNCT